LLQGGDEEWLKGIKHAPQKFQMLSVLNKLLAHRPWLVTSQHIKVCFRLIKENCNVFFIKAETQNDAL